MMMHEPPNRTEILLQKMLDEQHEHGEMLHAIRHHVSYATMILLVAFLLHFIGCPIMDGVRQERYQSLGHQAMPSRLLPP